MSDEAPPPSLAVREHIIAALHADLIGPFDPSTGQELLRMSPSRWYLTGFLANEIVREADADTEDGELGSGDDFGDTGAESPAEPPPQVRRFLPASMGMSVLLHADTTEVEVRLRFADYAGMLRKDLPEDGPRPTGAQTLWWKRVERDWIPLRLAIREGEVDSKVAVPHSRGVEIVGRAERVYGVPGVPDGTLAASIFVVNRRQPEATGPRNPRRDEDYIFQVEFEVRAPGRLLGRQDHHLELAQDEDDRIIDLQYRDAREWAVGHGCATTPIHVDGEVNGEVIGVKSVWLPTSEVAKVETRPTRKTNVKMEELAKLDDADQLRAALEDLPREYGEWIDEQRRASVSGEKRRQMQQLLVHKAEIAKRRIEDGIALLTTDEQARRAFCEANAAMAASARQRRRNQEPKWRLFQLAFVLLNVRGIVDPTHDDRETVELIFFPTGGGKTEAYLGVIAFTLLLRRLRGQSRSDRGLGVAVMLRYTLRLLTLDQLGRAAGLICALELARRNDPAAFGNDRFSIGLWVGQSASPNRLSEAKRQIDEYRQNIGSSPFPLTNCPWCDEPIGPNCMTTQNVGKRIAEVVVSCANYKGKCPFSRAGGREGLPVLFVDEQIYRELPSFIVATVDKFAMLPWRGETGMLFGRVHSRQGKRYFGPNDSPAPGAGCEGLPQGLRPPELIVQDELHLIAGPLGTMVGLYETMIEQLASFGGQRPKIIAATATVRRASKQIRALFGRGDAKVFPPAGVDAWDTFFAQLDHKSPKRKYIGVAAGGRPIKRILINTYLALLAAAEHEYDRAQTSGEVQAADPYMTLVGYFNSLRELGGMRRLVEDEIHGRVTSLAKRRPEDWQGPHRWFANRTLGLEPVELTSRESTANIAKSKERLSRHFFEDKCVDVCLASNMISVGVDIDRLGLMVVAGQPKTTSEYIQASSRVGRQAQWPGLVVTVFNHYKPRDRSHYEHFEAYHANFYRYVESQSLTPFSGPALERGFAGVAVGMTRLGEPGMTHPKAVNELKQHREQAEKMIEVIAERAARHSRDVDGKRLANELRQRGFALLDSWQTVIDTAREGGAGGQRRYSGFDELEEGKPLLYLVGKGTPTSQHEAKFHAPTSMRDVEAGVHIWVDRSGFGSGGGH